jgi:hypothetical protein
VRPQGARSALWNVGLCGDRLEGPQLMRRSLGGRYPTQADDTRLTYERPWIVVRFLPSL